jgi:hypothetical protein
MERNIGRKKVVNLSIDDFRKNPVWTWFDVKSKEGVEVVPIPTEDILPKDIGRLFIYSNLTFADGLTKEGVICVQDNESKPYLIKFLTNSLELFSFPLQTKLKKFVDYDLFEQQMDKPLQKIFPLSYRTLFRLSDGSKFEGIIKFKRPIF